MSGDHNMYQKRPKTDKDKLDALWQYLTLNLDIVRYRLLAEQSHDKGNDERTWEWLFEWVERKHQRSELWKWFKHEYPDAIMLQEGMK